MRGFQDTVRGCSHAPLACNTITSLPQFPAIDCSVDRVGFFSRGSWPMPATIKCPMCKRALEVPDELMGKRVKCPGCKMIFTATPPGAAPSEDSSARRPRPGQKSEIGRAHV